MGDPEYLEWLEGQEEKWPPREPRVESWSQRGIQTGLGAATLASALYSGDINRILSALKGVNVKPPRGGRTVPKKMAYGYRKRRPAYRPKPSFKKARGYSGRYARKPVYKKRASSNPTLSIILKALRGSM